MIKYITTFLGDHVYITALPGDHVTVYYFCVCCSVFAAINYEADSLIGVQQDNVNTVALMSPNGIDVNLTVIITITVSDLTQLHSDQTPQIILYECMMFKRVEVNYSNLFTKQTLIQ